MSGSALGDHNLLPDLELDKKHDTYGKGNIIKPNTCNRSCVDIYKNSTSLSSRTIIEADDTCNGSEAGNAEFEYVESENLTELLDVDSSLNTLITRLESKDWVMLCEALNNVRQLSIYHREKLLELLGLIVPLIVKALKNPRSAVCKTAIMTCVDIFKIYSDLIIDSLDPLLAQLFLKSSQDKRFVCEAAETALIAMTASVSPAALLPKLQPYLKSKNPRVRAKASMCFSRSVPLLGVEGIKAYGTDKLIQIAATQLSDQLPESRDAARILALELQILYNKSRATAAEDPAQLDADSWAAFCQAKLSPLSAQAILRVTSTLKESVVLGC